jgi:hypothetical protein
MLRFGREAFAVILDVALRIEHRIGRIAVAAAPAVEIRNPLVELLDTARFALVEDRSHRIDPHRLGQAITQLRLRQQLTAPDGGRLFFELG